MKLVRRYFGGLRRREAARRRYGAMISQPDALPRPSLKRSRRDQQMRVQIMTARASGGVMRSMLVTTALATIAAVVLMETPALPQVDTNSGNYMLPLCQAFLRMQSHDLATITNELSTGSAQSGGIPLSMMQAGMCAGEVIGIAEMLKASDQPPRAWHPKGSDQGTVGPCSSGLRGKGPREHA
jgi:hypothetical protein